MDINQENIAVFKQNFSEAVNIAENLYFEDKVSIAKGLLNKLEQGELMLAFIGSTSAGKSTVINNLIQSPILPVSTIPTTGAMTLIRVFNGLSKPTFYKVSLKDGDSSVLDDDKVFAELSKNDADDYYLIADIPYNGTFPAGTIFMDVPGYNSLRNRHDSILTQWLPEMDQIVWVINARTGVAQSDKAFFNHAKEIIGEMPLETLTLLVNIPEQKFIRRVEEIKRHISQLNNGQIPKTFIVAFKEKQDRHAILDVDELQRNLKNMFSDEERNKLIFKRVHELARFWLEDLKQTARCIYSQNESDKDKIVERLEHLKKQKTESIALLDINRKEWSKIIDKTVEELQAKLWEGIEQAIKNGSTLSAKETADHVAEFVINDVIYDNCNQFINKFEDEYNKICEQLETILMDSISKEWAPDMQDFDYDPGKGVDNEFVKQTSRGFASKGISGYLSKLGGRGAGSGVVGVMNFARKGMGWINKTGKFIGMEKNIFGKNAMNKVGPLLKRFGLTTARVTEAGAYIAMEAVGIIYKSVTWKPKLRSRYKEILDNTQSQKSKEDPRPVYDYNKELIFLSEESIKALKEEVEILCNSRLESLEVQKKYYEDEKMNTKWREDYQILQNIIL